MCLSWCRLSNELQVSPMHVNHYQSQCANLNHTSSEHPHISSPSGYIQQYIKYMAYLRVSYLLRLRIVKAGV